MIPRLKDLKIKLTLTENLEEYSFKLFFFLVNKKYHFPFFIFLYYFDGKITDSW